MAPKNWFIHLEGETFGPLTESLVLLLLRQNRLRFSDFGVSEGMTQWKRLSEVSVFADLLPPYPVAAPPRDIPAATISEKDTAQTLSDIATKFPPPKSMSPASQLRRAKRVPINGSITFDGVERFKVLNISDSGLLIDLPEGVPLIGKEVRFRLDAPALGKTLHMTGILIRETKHDHDPAVAIEFTKVNPAHARTIKAYIDEKLAAA